MQGGLLQGFTSQLRTVCWCRVPWSWPSEAWETSAQPVHRWTSSRNRNSAERGPCCRCFIYFQVELLDISVLAMFRCHFMAFSNILIFFQMVQSSNCDLLFWTFLHQPKIAVGIQQLRISGLVPAMVSALRRHLRPNDWRVCGPAAGALCNLLRLPSAAAEVESCSELLLKVADPMGEGSHGF